MIDSRREDTGYESGSAASSLEAGMDAVREKVGEAKGVAKEKLHRLKEATAEKLEQGWDTVKSWEHTVEGQIGRHPITSVLIAAGAGLLVGLLCRRSD